MEYTNSKYVDELINNNIQPQDEPKKVQNTILNRFDVEFQSEVCKLAENVRILRDKLQKIHRIDPKPGNPPEPGKEPECIADRLHGTLEFFKRINSELDSNLNHLNEIV